MANPALKWNADATYVPWGQLQDTGYNTRPASVPTAVQDWTPPPAFQNMPINGIGSGLAPSDYSHGIAGGIGGPDGKDYKFLNDFIGYMRKPEQTVPPNFSGPSQDYGYGNPPPVSQPVPAAPQPKTPTVSFTEGASLYDDTVPPNFSGPSADYGYGNQQPVYQPAYDAPMPQAVNPRVSFTEGDLAVPDYRDVQNQSFLDRNGMGIAKAAATTFIPGAGAALGLYNAGNAAYTGYQEGKSGGPLGTQYAIGDGQSSLPVNNKPGLLSQLWNMSGTVGDAIGNAVGSTVGGAPIEAMAGPKRWADMTDAEKNMEGGNQSLYEAYSQKSVYDPNGSGWHAVPNTPSTPPPTGPMANYDQWAQAYPEFAAPNVPDLSWSDINGPAWGFNAAPWAGDFGAGRYADSTTNPYSASFGDSFPQQSGSSGPQDMWGPLSRWVADPFNTD